MHGTHHRRTSPRRLHGCAEGARLNILHLEDERWDSGLAAYAVTLAAEQARRRHRVELWGRRGSPVLEQARALGLAACGWPGLAGGLPWWPAMRRAAAALAPRVINAHTGSSHALALFLSSGRACAVVRTRADARAPRANPLSQLAAARTSMFVAANSALESALRSAFPSAPVARVPQGVAGPDAPTPLSLEPVVGLLARLDPVKGHEMLFEALAAAAVPGLRARCAGEGRLAEALATRAKELGAPVELLGRVCDRWAFLASCRAGIVPSLGSEAVSRATLEWMAAGRPVIASRVGGLPDLVEHGVTGLLVPPGDAAALAQALRELLVEPGKAESMGQEGRRRWERFFSPAPFYEATQRVYERITAHIPS